MDSSLTNGSWIPKHPNLLRRIRRCKYKRQKNLKKEENKRDTRNLRQLKPRVSNDEL
jgi:hypothetical protein